MRGNCKALQSRSKNDSAIALSVVLFTRLREPLRIRRGVGAEGFQGAFVLVVEEAAVEAERARFGGVDQAGGVVGAHLEDDAHFKFAERLPAHGAVHVVEGVDAGEEVDAEGAAFGDDVGELGTGIGVAVAAGGEAEVVFVPEFLKLVQAVDEEEECGFGAGGARLEVGGDVAHHGGDVVGAGEGDVVAGGGDDLFDEVGLRATGGGV